MVAVAEALIVAKSWWMQLVGSTEWMACLVE